MMRIALFAALLVAAPAAAETQLQRLVANGLAAEGIEADVSALTTSQLAALHLELSSQTDPGEGDVRRRDVLLAILKQAAE